MLFFFCFFFFVLNKSILFNTGLMYSPLESGIGHLRGVEDNVNSIAAATITGLIYKSTGMCILHACV